MHEQLCPKCARSFECETTPANFCPYGCGEISSEAGYVSAFYELAEMMGIAARPCTPKAVWEREMRPRLALALAAGTTGDQR
jgi:hypothetical protein